MNLFEFDKSFNKLIVGTDEAGRGPAAGGVFASAVFINNPEIENDLAKLNDSKKLTKKVREELIDILDVLDVLEGLDGIDILENLIIR